MADKDYYDEEIERLEKMKDEMLAEEKKKIKLNRLNQQIKEIQQRKKKKGLFRGEGGLLDRMADGVNRMGEQLNKTVGNK